MGSARLAGADGADKRPTAGVGADKRPAAGAGAPVRGVVLWRGGGGVLGGCGAVIVGVGRAFVPPLDGGGVPGGLVGFGDGGGVCNMPVGDGGGVRNSTPRRPPFCAASADNAPTRRTVHAATIRRRIIVPSR